MLANYFFFCSLFFILGIVFKYYFPYYWFYFVFLSLVFSKRFIFVVFLVLSFYLGGFYLSFFEEISKDGYIKIIRELPPSEKNRKYLASLNGKNYILYYPIYNESLYPYDRLKVEGRILENKIFVKKVLEKKPSQFKKIYFLKEKLNNLIKETYSLNTSEIIKGLLYGEEISDNQLRSNFQKSGLSHLTAMSGYNLNILSVFWFKICNLIPLNFLFRNLLALVLIFIFVIFANFQSSVVRAFLMISVLILGKVIGRPCLTRNLIIFSLLVISLFNPKAILEDIGFQLSFLATIGILYFSEIIEKNFKSKLVSEILSSQIFVMPLILYKFGNFNPFAILSNLIIIPIVPILMILGLFAIIFYFLYPLNYIFNIPFEIFSYLIYLFSTFPEIYLNLPLWLLFFIYAYLFYYIFMKQKNEKIDFNFSY
jgi:competence protein ComEC